MNQFKIVSSVGLIFFLNAIPSFALSQSIIRGSNSLSSDRSTKISLIQTNRKNSELVVKISTNLAEKCGDIATKKGLPKKKVKDLMMVCIAVFQSNFFALRDKTITLPPLDGLKPKDKAFDIATKALFNRKDTMTGYKFIYQKLGKDEANELTISVLYGAAATFLQENQGIDMGL